MKTVNAGEGAFVGQRAGSNSAELAPQRPLIGDVAIRQRHLQGFVALNMADVGQLLCVQRQTVRLPLALVARLGRVQHRHALREQFAGLRIAQRIFRRQRQRRQSQ